jgi:hypothetical protein
MVRLRLRVYTSLARYLSFLDAITEKMARAFAEGVTTSKKLSLERCGLKNPLRVRCRPWHGSARALPHYRFALPKKSSLRRLLWKQCSYMIGKSTSCVHIEPFLRYLWFEGRLLESSWLGRTVDFR